MYTCDRSRPLPTSISWLTSDYSSAYDYARKLSCAVCLIASFFHQWLIRTCNASFTPRKKKKEKKILCRAVYFARLFLGIFDVDRHNVSTRMMTTAIQMIASFSHVDKGPDDTHSYTRKFCIWRIEDYYHSISFLSFICMLSSPLVTLYIRPHDRWLTF